MPYKFFAYEEDFYNSYLSFRKDIDAIRKETSKAEISEYKAFIDDDMETSEKQFLIENGVAYIPVKGSLTNNPDPCAYMFGVQQTLYSDIINQTKQANENKEVSKIRYIFDTPGGHVSGVEQAAIAIRNSEKPTEAYVYNMAASAGYWLASNTDKIIAADKTVSVGSIGVVTELIDFSAADEKDGVKRYTITSTDAPDKRPDISKKEGREKIISELDDIHNVFVENVANGRKVSKETVKNDFGKGGMLIAENALKVGMIDEINSESIKITEDKNVNNTPQKSAEIENNTQEAEKVDKKTLKAEHPDLYADIKAEGVQEEQKRIAELDAYADINADVSSVIAKAKAEGKTVDAVLPEIMKASAMSKPAIEAQADNAPEINAADSGDIVDSESAVEALLAMSKEV